MFHCLLFSYIPPVGDETEEVVVQRFTIPEDTCKREIYVLSDLHMGGDWSLEIGPRLEEFMKTLAKTAGHYVHSIILLGDIFEMWLTPMAVTPPTIDEYLVQWKSDEVNLVIFWKTFLMLHSHSMLCLRWQHSLSKSVRFEG